MKENTRKQMTDLRLIVFDFDGVFTDNRVIVNEDGKESVVCNRADGIGLSALRSLGMDLLILSSEPNGIVKRRSVKLKIKCINNCKNKLKALSAEVKKRKLSFRQVAYVGNDINDLECLRVVGFPVAVKNSYKDILRCVKFRTQMAGGQGAVREICDLIYTAKTGGRRHA